MDGWMDGWTGKTKLTVTFHNFENVTKNGEDESKGEGEGERKARRGRCKIYKIRTRS
jgi:hypothetical protein